MRKRLLASIAVALGLGVSSAWALPACSTDTPDVTSLVTGTSMCVVYSGQNLSTSAINGGALDDMFGLGYAWKELEKQEDGSIGATTGPYLTTDGDRFSGDWTITGSPSPYNVFALLFKAGNTNNTDPDSQVIYLTSSFSGLYESPHFQQTCTSSDPLADCTQRALSHFGLLGAYDPTKPPPDFNPTPPGVPLPASALLLMGAFGGVAALRRKRKAA